jgi:DNA-binding MarR family transcriptional regulator
MTTSSIEHTRTHLVQGLFEGLLQFSRALRARSGDWGHALPELSRGDLVTLGVIERGGSMRPGHIALALEVDPSVVSRQLAALGKQGLVARDTDPHDRRAELVSVTRLGRERLLQARATMCGVLADRVAAWDAETLATASSVLEDLSRVLSDAPAPSDTARSTHTTKEDHA